MENLPRGGEFKNHSPLLKMLVASESVSYIRMYVFGEFNTPL